MAGKQQPVTNPRIVKLMELEAAGRMKPEHQAELDSYRARGIVSAPKPLTEGEAKTTNFYNSALGAENEWKSLEADPELAPGTQPVGMMGDIARAILPANVVNSNTSSARQRAQQAKENFIRASLRLESGAAIGKDEFNRQDRIFYPQTGDTPATLEQKARARQQVIEGFKIGAGAGSRQVDHLRQDDAGKEFVPMSVDSATDYALGLRDKKPGMPERLPDGSVAVQMPDGTRTTFPNQAAYERSTVEDQLAGVFGGDRNSEGYRAAYKARFGEDAPLPAVEAPDGKPLMVDMKDGATGAFGRGMGDAVTFGGLDELGGVADTLIGEGGDGSFTDRLGRNITRNRGILAFDRERHPYAQVSGQLVGGAVIPLGAGVRSAAGLARVGALSGAAYGFGSGEGNALERVPNALSGAAVGAIGGYTFGRAAPVVGDALARLRPGPSAVRAEANALAQASERQQVPMTAADLRPGARNMTAYLEASPGGAGPVQDALRAGNEALDAAVGRIGGGSVQMPEAMGTTIQDAGRRMIERTRQIKNDLYADAERLAPATTVRSQNAVDAIDRNIAELSETPNANRGLLSLLQDMRADLVVPDASTGRYTPRGLSIASIRNLRTAMRGEIGSRNLTMTDAERRVGQVIDAASSDITDALSRTNPSAAAAYRRADQYYAERQRYIRDVVQHYTGPRDRPHSGEQAYHRVLALTGTKGDRERLAAVMRGLNPDERGDVASTVAASLGRRTPDDDFSPARFVTQAQKMTAGAREAVFGTEGAEAINDLIHIATAKRDVGNSLNRSRSGQVSNYDRWLTGGLSLLGGGAGYATGGAGGAAIGAVTASAVKAGALNLSARLLTNPQFVRWLGRAPTNATPAQITAHVRQLGNLAIRQPAIRGEIGQLQRLLGETSARSAVASDRAPSNDQEPYREQAAAAGR